MRRMDARVLSGQPRISKSLLNARLCRLTETARLLKNVKSVFTRRSNAASRVSVEVELSRKLSLPQTLAHIRRNSRVRCPGSVPPPNRSSESIVLPRNCDPRETTFSHGGKTALTYIFFLVLYVTLEHALNFSRLPSRPPASVRKLYFIPTSAVLNIVF